MDENATCMASCLAVLRQSSCSDKDSEFGPPDKRGHFSKQMCGKGDAQVTICQVVEVRNDDNVWYKGKLNAETDEWIAQFDIDRLHKTMP